ncbi:hypothetical protein [Clostridium gasigenes]|uniref:Uncharacterized protein n=1 Tax=Clostridium gasigenes TaxID=94869 RepID=A0A7X0VSC3_9CLOT|nr:hypothetical protein [Clostridium gasigenes]MBB6716339.1 hypothetical protein [Clostridium gasigenes]
MGEGYEVLKELLAVAINVSVSTRHRVGYTFIPGLDVLVISIEFSEPHHQFHEGLKKTWEVKVKNTDMLKVVLDEIKQLEEPVKDDFLE